VYSSAVRYRLLGRLLNQIYLRAAERTFSETAEMMKGRGGGDHKSYI